MCTTRGDALLGADEEDVEAAAAHLRAHGVAAGWEPADELGSGGVGAAPAVGAAPPGNGSRRGGPPVGAAKPGGAPGGATIVDRRAGPFGTAVTRTKDDPPAGVATTGYRLLPALVLGF